MAYSSISVFVDHEYDNEDSGFGKWKIQHFFVIKCMQPVLITAMYLAKGF